MALKDELTFDNALAYARTCVDVAYALSSLNAEGRKNIVLPSRGAWPIYKTADHVRETLGHVAHDFLCLPFTSDESQGLDSALVRKHWVRVLAADCRGEANDNWEYFQRKAVEFGGRRRPPAKLDKFVLLDTAVSGRAAAEIIAAMNGEGLDYHLILVVDQNGRKLRPEYARVLDAESHRVTRFFVPALYTEDRGPALMGITTALFPRLTRGDAVMSLWASIPHKPVFYAPELGGNPSLHSITDYFSAMHAMHFYATHIALKKPWGADEEAVAYFLDLLLKHEHLTHEQATLGGAKLGFGSMGTVELTSSMAIRVT